MLSMVNILRYDSSIIAVLLGGGVRGCVRGGLGKFVFVPVFVFLL